MSCNYTTAYEKNEMGYNTLEANSRCVVQAVVTFISFSLLCSIWIVFVARSQTRTSLVSELFMFPRE